MCSCANILVVNDRGRLFTGLVIGAKRALFWSHVRAGCLCRGVQCKGAAFGSEPVHCSYSVSNECAAPVEASRVSGGDSLGLGEGAVHVCHD